MAPAQWVVDVPSGQAPRHVLAFAVDHACVLQGKATRKTAPGRSPVRGAVRRCWCAGTATVANGTADWTVRGRRGASRFARLGDATNAAVPDAWPMRGALGAIASEEANKKL